MKKHAAIHPFIIVFGILTGLFTLSMFFRVSIGVIGSDLMRSFGISAEALGRLGGVFFYAFAALQLAVGPMLDGIGPQTRHFRLRYYRCHRGR